MTVDFITVFVMVFLPEYPYLFVVNRIFGINKCDPDEESSVGNISTTNNTKISTDENAEDQKNCSRST